MNAPEKIFLPDIQATPDTRQLAIQQVGIKDLRLPLEIVDETTTGEVPAVQTTIARATMTVGLTAEVKGTHMSRFVELLEAPREPLNFAAMAQLLDEMLQRLDAASGRIDLVFPFFVWKAAPVSGARGRVDYDVRWIAEKEPGRDAELTLEVTAPVTSLCPCSKEISAYGAHNQRSLITLRATLRAGGAGGSIRALIDLAEAAASCEVYGLLKRSDEKWVTERAYDNPKFVEDLVRDIALRLGEDARIARWTVISENFESIHNHSAYAELHGRND